MKLKQVFQFAESKLPTGVKAKTETRETAPIASARRGLQRFPWPYVLDFQDTQPLIRDAGSTLG